MRRNKGLLIAIIIIIILLVATLIGLVLYKFVFNKNTNKPNNQDQSANVPAEQEKADLKIGDYVEYTPDKAENYVVSGTESGAANNSLDGIKQEKLNWRILNINEDGTIDLISEKPLSTEVYFGGALGYNNAVYLLNDICKELYSNKNLKATARSIKLEDIEDKMSDIAKTARSAYENNDVAYGETKKFEDVYVPEVYTKSTKKSDKYYSEATTNTFVPQGEISIKNTFYGLEDITEDYFEDEDVYEVIFGTKEGYWLATRCEDASSSSAIFGICTASEKQLSGVPMCSSNSKSWSNQNYVRPIVTLGKDVELSVEGGTKSEPRTINGGDAQAEEPETPGTSGDAEGKIDEDKDWVYDAEYTYGNLAGKSYKSTVTSETYSLDDIRVPYININSSDAKKANDEIKKIFEKSAQLFEEELEGEKAKYVTVDYEQYVTDDRLSIRVATHVGGTEALNFVYYAYNFNLEDGKKLSYEDTYKLAGFSSNNIDSAAEEAVTESYEYSFKGIAEGEDFDEYNEKTIKNYRDSVSRNTIKYYIDDEEKLNIIVEFAIPEEDGKYEAIVTVE